MPGTERLDRLYACAGLVDYMPGTDELYNMWPMHIALLSIRLSSLATAYGLCKELRQTDRAGTGMSSSRHIACHP